MELKQYSHYVRSVSRITLAIALALTLLKLVFWRLTGSVGLLASLMDSSLDVISSSFGFFTIRYALKPADDDHRFGHGKAEAIGGLVQCAFTAGCALFLVLEALGSFRNPSGLSHTYGGIMVMVVSTILTFGLTLYQKWVIRKTASVAIHADHLHYEMDVLQNIAVMAGIFFNERLGNLFDPFVGLLVGCFIFYGAYKIGVSAIHALMDKDLGPEFQAEIESIVYSFADVKGIHALKTRQAGYHKFIQMHIELSGDMSLKAAHDIGDEIENSIRQLYPEADVIIHEDPV